MYNVSIYRFWGFFTSCDWVLFFLSRARLSSRRGAYWFFVTFCFWRQLQKRKKRTVFWIQEDFLLQDRRVELSISPQLRLWAATKDCCWQSWRGGKRVNRANNLLTTAFHFKWSAGQLDWFELCPLIIFAIEDIWLDCYRFLVTGPGSLPIRVVPSLHCAAFLTNPLGAVLHIIGAFKWPTVTKYPPTRCKREPIFLLITAWVKVRYNSLYVQNSTSWHRPWFELNISLSTADLTWQQLVSQIFLENECTLAGSSSSDSNFFTAFVVQSRNVVYRIEHVTVTRRLGHRNNRNRKIAIAVFVNPKHVRSGVPVRSTARLSNRNGKELDEHLLLAIDSTSSWCRLAVVWTSCRPERPAGTVATTNRASFVSPTGSP